MSKNPFELRFDLLQYARGNLMDKYYIDIELYKEDKLEKMPTFPTTEDIFKLAEEYKAFIERK